MQIFCEGCLRSNKLWYTSLRNSCLRYKNTKNKNKSRFFYFLHDTRCFVSQQGHTYGGGKPQNVSLTGCVLLTFWKRVMWELHLWTQPPPPQWRMSWMGVKQIKQNMIYADISADEFEGNLLKLSWLLFRSWRKTQPWSTYNCVQQWDKHRDLTALLLLCTNSPQFFH